MKEQNMFYGAKPLSFERAKHLRQNMTPEEKDLWESLKGKQLLNLKFRRQHPVGNFIVDFYCHKIKLVIEIDGPIHQFQPSKDMQRETSIKNLGLFVLRFRNEDINRNLKNVIQIIKEKATAITE